MDYSTHEKLMRHCFQLALKGLGEVSPNPLVGAIITNKRGDILGQGFHQRSGKPHAEVEAINDAKKKGHVLKGTVLYCNLEPCCHTNKKTPPCCDLIIREEISAVVISNNDPNPLVSGRGVEKLRHAGIEVITEVLKKNGEELNKVFFHCMQKNRPFVHIKVAQTLDGKIATDCGHSKWITNESARKEVHFLRKKYDAIMVGSGTLEQDDPELSIRMGVEKKDKDYYRIIVGDSSLNDLDKKVFKSDEKNLKTILMTSEKAAEAREKMQHVEIVSVDRDESGINLHQALDNLYKRHICSILLEGGTSLISSFINNNLYDALTVYVSPKLIGNGFSLYTNDLFEKIDQSLMVEFKSVRILEGQIVIEATPKEKEDECLQD